MRIFFRTATERFARQQEVAIGVDIVGIETSVPGESVRIEPVNEHTAHFTEVSGSLFEKRELYGRPKETFDAMQPGREDQRPDGSGRLSGRR